MVESTAVPELSFDQFLTYEEMTRLLRSFAVARPDLCRLESLGASREGRQVNMLTVTRFQSGAPEDKPAYLVHGNIHAGELSGTHAAVYTARQLLVEEPDLLRRAAFYIVPRLNPDGAEFAVTTCARIRSRTEDAERLPNRLYQEDIDGNGLILSMRLEHTDGTFVKDPQDPRLMVRRRFDSQGPFYRMLPEGLIHQWDGSEEFLAGGRSFDWNRNWSYDWRPEPEQAGSGDFPFSEPEMRHLAEFIYLRPNLFGILGYHTGSAAVLRPPSTGGDRDLDESDLRVMKELAEIGARETGFQVIPVVKYHVRNRRDINLRGHFHNFGYYHLGIFVFEFELGNLQNSAGISTKEIFEACTEKESEDRMRRLMEWWSCQERKEPLFRDWQSFNHPQLGPVEIGGFLTPHLANPSLKELRRIVRGTYRFTLEHANRCPRLVLEDLRVDKVGEDMHRIRVRVANRGAFPTNITNKGLGLRRLQPVRVRFSPAARVKMLSLRTQFEIGHLEGDGGSRLLEWFVAGKGDELGEINLSGGTGGSTNRPVRIS